MLHKTKQPNAGQLACGQAVWAMHDRCAPLSFTAKCLMTCAQRHCHMGPKVRSTQCNAAVFSSSLQLQTKVTPINRK